MTCSFDGLDPPGIAGELEQHRWMLPELLEFVDERVLQLVERRENGIGKVFAQMPEDLLGETPVQDCRVVDRADACPVATSPPHCDDCPNYPARPRADPFPTRGADASGRSAGIGLPRSAAEERRLCRWWVPPLHTATATRTRLARSKGDVPPKDTSVVAARSSGQSGPHRKPRLALALVV